MPHAALWVVQLITAFVVVATACCFNAARGFVGGAALKNPEEDEDEEGFNAARGFVGGAAKIRLLMLEGFFVSMPHAALWVVQRNYMYIVIRIRTVSMPHAALWVVQRNCPHPLGRRRVVSMPHAALWVVQQTRT